jgi:hypothetical protein
MKDWGRHSTNYMLDTNTFDYIYDSGLTNKIRNSVDSGKIRLFATDVQRQEIEGILDNTKKHNIQQVTEAIRVKFTETSAAVVALSQQNKRGYIGSRVGAARVASEQDIQLLETLKKVNMKHPLKNMADLLIFYTAIREDMDYLITGNVDDFVRPLEIFRMDRATKLQIKNNTDFEGLLNAYI